MTKIGIGLIREGKIPVDKRVAMIPRQCREFMDQNPQVKIVAESSDIRCYTDQEYIDAGIEVRNEVDDCHILLGVKEVPLDKIIANKTYLFFSHTIKMQEYNRELLRKVRSKNVRLIDYELITDENGVRVIAFGRYAGIVGAYNGILNFGKRYNLFKLRPAHQCKDLEELQTEFVKVKLPNIKIALTGGGRVAKGAMEVLNGMGIKRVSAREFLSSNFQEPVYTQLNSRDYYQRKDGMPFKRNEFHGDPSGYKSIFMEYANLSDILIAGAYWDPRAPVLFKREDCIGNGFHIKVIADITCDIEGSIPSTKKPSTIDDPVYDYNPEEDSVEAPFSDEANITVMAVDTLPNELPRDSSRDFGQELVDHVIPALVKLEKTEIISKATIVRNQQIQERFKYLENWLDS
jgi:alanine dehydrogenase